MTHTRVEEIKSETCNSKNKKKWHLKRLKKVKETYEKTKERKRDTFESESEQKQQCKKWKWHLQKQKCAIAIVEKALPNDNRDETESEIMFLILQSEHILEEKTELENHILILNWNCALTISKGCGGTAIMNYAVTTTKYCTVTIIRSCPVITTKHCAITISRESAGTISKGCAMHVF